MKVVGLLSGGKDSCYALCKLVSLGHEVVAVANLAPPDVANDEKDSHMFQTIGHQLIASIAQCIGVPLYTRGLRGNSEVTSLNYSQTQGDEVEDLYELVRSVKEAHPDLTAVASGAILSNYQRLRVEHICTRLGLTSLAPIWERQQESMLDEMIHNGVEAILIKVASMGLEPKQHLGKTLKELQPHLLSIGSEFGVNVCGEGGEYETLTLDCPIFRSRIVLDTTEIIGDLTTGIAPVAVLRISKWHLESKGENYDAKAACLRMTTTAVSNSRIEQQLDHRSVADIRSACIEKKQVLRINPFPASAQSIFEPFPSPCDLTLPSANQVADHCFVSNQHIPSSNSSSSSSSSDSAGSTITRTLNHIQQTLESKSFGLADVFYVQLALQSMSSFGEVNDAYKSILPMQNAASRACVECAPLPSLDASAPSPAFNTPPLHADMMCLRTKPNRIIGIRENLHVQSISAWAPCCIGPYSQANCVHRTFVWMAGQIGLHPMTMTLISDPVQQLQASLTHVKQILANYKLQPVKHCFSVVCYWDVKFWRDPNMKALLEEVLLPLCEQEYNDDSCKLSVLSPPPATATTSSAATSPAPAAAVATAASTTAGIRSPLGRGGMIRRPIVSRPAASSSSSSTTTPTVPPRKCIVHLAVSHLPRDAIVEIQVVAAAKIGSSNTPSFPKSTALRSTNFTSSSTTVASSASSDDAASPRLSATTHSTFTSGLFASMWSRLQLHANVEELVASKSLISSRHLVDGFSSMLDLIYLSLQESRLKWSTHILLVRLYHTPVVSEAELRQALIEACAAQRTKGRRCKLPAVSFVRVHDLTSNAFPSQCVDAQGMVAPTSSEAQLDGNAAALVAMHTLFLSKQMASNEFDAMRIDSDEENEDEHEQ